MEKLNKATLILNDQSYITYSITNAPFHTTDEVDFWFITNTEKLLICKDSFAEIVLRSDYVLNKAFTRLQTSDELDKMAKLYAKTFLTKQYQSIDFDKYMFFDGVGYTTWISWIESTKNFYLRIDHVVSSKKQINIFSGFVDKNQFLSWWSRVNFELRHLLKC